MCSSITTSGAEICDSEDEWNCYSFHQLVEYELQGKRVLLIVNEA